MQACVPQNTRIGHQEAGATLCHIRGCASPVRSRILQTTEHVQGAWGGNARLWRMNHAIATIVHANKVYETAASLDGRSRRYSVRKEAQRSCKLRTFDPESLDHLDCRAIWGVMWCCRKRLRSDRRDVGLKVHSQKGVGT